MIPFAVDENTFSLFGGVGVAHCLTSYPIRPFSDGLRPQTLEPLLASCHHTADVLVKKILNYLQGSGGRNGLIANHCLMTFCAIIYTCMPCTHHCTYFQSLKKSKYSICGYLLPSPSYCFNLHMYKTCPPVSLPLRGWRWPPTAQLQGDS